MGTDGTAISQQSLDKNFGRWLKGLANKWQKSEPEAARILGWVWGEIANRTHQYPELAIELRRPRLNKHDTFSVLQKCYSFKEQFSATRLSEFFGDNRSASVILSLVRNFPKSDRQAAIRIDRFVEKAVHIAYKSPDSESDRAGATLLASVLLTALEPERFVDFRRRRWVGLAEKLDYQFSEIDGYGEWLVQASHFAQAVCRTKTFKRYWPDQEPLWALSGICWIANSPQTPSFKDLPPSVFPGQNGFPEGKPKKRLHLDHERNPKVVKLAKQYAWQRDRSLPCEVCEFSFTEKYGDWGEKFIEAHHKKPVASLKAGQRTKVEDIALVCANCHRMLHAGNRTLSIEELRNLLCD